MSKRNDRRAFLGKFIAGLSGIVALPLLTRAEEKEEKSNNQTKEQEMKKIKNIRPLSFQWETSDPFLFCVHHEDNFPNGNENFGPDQSLLSGRNIGSDFILKDGWRMYHGSKVPGFPGHPHRGFETITVVRHGLVDHADSTGASGRYGNGDVQWMTAGKGVQHSEMFPLLNKDERNPLELFQIWLNLPRKSKMVEPHFKMFWSESIPVFQTDNDKVKVEVLVGKYDTYSAPAAPPDSWASDPNNDVCILNIHMEEGSEFELMATNDGVNRTLFFYEGTGLEIEDETIPHYHAAEVQPDTDLKIRSTSGTNKLLMLQGRPINEPVVQHGPFVMNTRAEIHEAFEDYHATQFGGWPWGSYDVVHGPKKIRFAKHSDGREEIKEA